jgi:glycosyltransferase involved in cell wall biosynthesis
MGARRESIDGFTIWDHGVTAPSGDVEAFSRALRFLIERPELRDQMGASGRAFVTMRMSKERLLRDVEQIYCELAGRGLGLCASTEPPLFSQSQVKGEV